MKTISSVTIQMQTTLSNLRECAERPFFPLASLQVAQALSRRLRLMHIELDQLLQDEIDFQKGD